MRKAIQNNGKLTASDETATRCDSAVDVHRKCNVAEKKGESALQDYRKTKRLVVRADHRFRKAGMIALQRSCEVGQHLTELKLLCPPGAWQATLQELADECDMSERMAQLHMKIFREWGRIEEIAESRGGHYPSLHEVQKLLSAKSHLAETDDTKLRCASSCTRLNDARSPKSTECLAPESVLKATLEFFPQGITLDPAAENASEHVPAELHYTKDVDGLADASVWVGSIFLHPPCDDGDAGRWIEKLKRESRSPEFTECVLLLPVRSDLEFFHDLTALSPSIVFVTGRLEFPNSGPATFPSMIAYVGKRHADFAQSFAHFGPLLRPACSVQQSGDEVTAAAINKRPKSDDPHDT